MATWELIEYNTPDTQHLSDLCGVREDLIATKRLCDRFISASTDITPDAILIQEALCAAALIRYGRSFATGVRKWDHQNIIESLSEQHKIDHEMFITLRNKWIAHSVNSFEENIVQVNLVPEERGPKGPAWVSVCHCRVVCLGSEHIQRLGELSEIIVKHVEPLIEIEKKSIMTRLSDLPVESLYSMLSIQRPKPHMAHYSKKRVLY